MTGGDSLTSGFRSDHCLAVFKTPVYRSAAIACCSRASTHPRPSALSTGRTRPLSHNIASSSMSTLQTSSHLSPLTPLLCISLLHSSLVESSHLHPRFPFLFIDEFARSPVPAPSSLARLPTPSPPNRPTIRRFPAALPRHGLPTMVHLKPPLPNIPPPHPIDRRHQDEKTEDDRDDRQVLREGGAECFEC